MRAPTQFTDRRVQSVLGVVLVLALGVTILGIVLVLALGLGALAFAQQSAELLLQSGMYQEDVTGFRNLDRLPTNALIAHASAYWLADLHAELLTDHQYIWRTERRCDLASSYWRPLYVTISPFAYAQDFKVVVVPEEKMRLTMRPASPMVSARKKIQVKHTKRKTQLRFTHAGTRSR